MTDSDHCVKSIRCRHSARTERENAGSPTGCDLHPDRFDLTALSLAPIVGDMKQKKDPNKARKEVQHRAFLQACENGWKPQRAATFTNRKKEADRKACRNRKDWQ